jgi:hypothetical protein
MTKKDYEKIAAAFAVLDNNPPERATDEYVRGRCIGRSDALYTLSEVFRKDNPRFDQDKFLAACGL